MLSYIVTLLSSTPLSRFRIKSPSQKDAHAETAEPLESDHSEGNLSSKQRTTQKSGFKVQTETLRRARHDWSPALESEEADAQSLCGRCGRHKSSLYL